MCPDISSNSFFPQNYQAFRHDRDLSRGKQRGGGVLVTLHDSIECKRHLDLELETEYIWLEVLVLGSNTSYYVPTTCPSETQAADFKNSLNSIKTIVASHSDHNFLIAGDFNAPDIS